MGKVERKRSFFLIYPVIIWVFLCLVCTPGTGDMKLGQKPAPVFQPQASITMADGTVYEVADFAFYSKHRRFKGGMYYPTSGTIRWPLYLKQGIIWKKFDLAEVKSLAITKKKYSEWLEIDLLTIDNKSFRGTLPTSAFDNLWHKQGFLHLTGKSEVLGRIGAFKCHIYYVSSLERLDAAEGPPTFKIIHGKNEKKETIITYPQLKIIWTKTTPKSLDIYTLTSNMPVTVNGIEIKIKPGEIETVTVPQRSAELFTVKMKQGDTVKVNLPPRIFGKLKNGDIIFSYMFGSGKPIVKQIQIKRKGGNYEK